MNARNTNETFQLILSAFILNPFALPIWILLLLGSIVTGSGYLMYLLFGT